MSALGRKQTLSGSSFLYKEYPQPGEACTPLFASARRDTDPINGSIAHPFFCDMKILLDPVVTTGIKLLIFKPETQIGLPGSNCHGNLW